MNEKHGNNQKNIGIFGGKSALKRDEKVYRVIVIGGGAAGLFFAAKYGDDSTLILERGERAGKKLSATGGGWGNVTNVNAANFTEKQGYFTFEPAEISKIRGAVQKYPPENLRGFLSSLGVLTFADERGRAYPVSRQASSITDCLRREAARRGTEIRTGEFVTDVFVLDNSAKKGEINSENNSKINGENNGEINAARFEIKTSSGGAYLCENVLICTGGKAAKNFGSDGNGYEIAKSLGHGVTPVSPALVQIGCAEKDLRALKGIRVFDGEIALLSGGREIARERGDILFTDFGVSGDCAFKISSYLPRVFSAGECVMQIDFLPEIAEAELEAALLKKLALYKEIPAEELAGGLLNNRAGAVIAGRAKKRLAENQSKNQSKNQSVGRERATALAAAIAKEMKSFVLTATGTLGFDYAQVTKGGVKLAEADENMQSLKHKGVYFAGEILDADGACGGYNLQWAYSSACAAGEAIFGKSNFGKTNLGSGAKTSGDCKKKGR